MSMTLFQVAPEDLFISIQCRVSVTGNKSTYTKKRQLTRGLLSTPAAATATTATTMRDVPSTGILSLVHITDAELSILLNACTKVKAALRQDKSPVAQNMMKGTIESEQDSYK